MRLRVIGLALWLALPIGVNSQSFLNLDFEQAEITILFPPSPGFPYERGIADVPNWAAYGTDASNYSGGTRLWYNSQTLDSPGVTLEGVSYWIPAIEGNYSVLLQGGSAYYPGREGASLWQTGEIPLWARSLTYGGTWTSFEVTFSGEPLSFVPTSSTSNHVVYGANISAYAGQVGELRFTAPWQTMGMLDAIQFSPAVIPEPTLISLVKGGAVCLIAVRLCSRKRRNRINC